jgi:hypothetical protein
MPAGGVLGDPPRKDVHMDAPPRRRAHLLSSDLSSTKRFKLLRRLVGVVFQANGHPDTLMASPQPT